MEVKHKFNCNFRDPSKSGVKTKAVCYNCVHSWLLTLHVPSKPVTCTPNAPTSTNLTQEVQRLSMMQYQGTTTSLLQGIVVLNLPNPQHLGRRINPSSHQSQWLFVCLYACMFVCLYVCLFVCLYVCIMYVCMYVCMFVCLFVCLFEE